MTWFKILSLQKYTIFLKLQTDENIFLMRLMHLVNAFYYHPRRGERKEQIVPPADPVNIQHFAQDVEVAVIPGSEGVVDFRQVDAAVGDLGRVQRVSVLDGE